jgi:hypothetical protein
MNNQNIQIIFNAKAHAGVMQDKYPPGRITAAAGEPATANTVADIFLNTNSTRIQNHDERPAPADNRRKHHGSETRQTQQIAGRIPFHLKAEVVRVAKLKGWTESKTVATLVEQALAGNLAEQFSVMLKTTLQDAVTKQMQKENNRAGNLALEAFYSAEEGRILNVYLLRFLLGEDISLLPQIIKDCQEQARENVSRALHERKEEN